MNLLSGILKSYTAFPDHKALKIGDKSYSYSELITIANTWAYSIKSGLHAQQVKRIGILAAKEFTSYTGIITSLMLGATYIPIHSKLPTDRIINIIEQSELDIIIFDSHYSQILNTACKTLLEQNNKRIKTFCYENIKLNEFQYFESVPLVCSHENIFLNTNINESDIAYILFTSGSTGNPKGVPISHKNVCRFLAYNQARYQITPADKLSQTFEHSFDLSVFDMFMAWFHGASVHCITPIELLSPEAFINENNITVWFPVPAIIGLLKRQNFLEKNIFPTLRLSLFCGEPLLADYIKSWAEAAPNSVCENLYGPTELTICCAHYCWQQCNNIIHNDIVSIGQIYSHLNFCIINENNEIINNDEKGELCVSGEQMFSGYLNKADNENKFITKKVENNEYNFYKTGDIVKRDQTGNLLYIGRIDRQIKLNGYRIELSEVENIIQTQKNVENVVAALVENKITNEKYISIHAFGNVNIEDIEKHIELKVPSYMKPKKIKVSKEPILNSNGKLDRKSVHNQLLLEGSQNA